VGASGGDFEKVKEAAGSGAQCCWRLLAVWDIHGEATEGGFFVFLGHIDAGLAHRFNRGVKRDKVAAIAAQGQRGG